MFAEVSLDSGYFEHKVLDLKFLIFISIEGPYIYIIWY